MIMRREAIRLAKDGVRVVPGRGLARPALARAVRREVSALDPEQPVARVATMEELLDTALSPSRFNLLLLGFFASAALGLAALGLYGVVSYSVRQRTHEVGVRIALGAGRWQVLRQVVGEGMLLTAGGLALGLAGSLALTRVLAGLLFDVRPNDPWVLTAVSGLLAGIALLASYFPARRATKVDPVGALRAG
ncbi:MAG TPA: FtsX-like permease family protein [Thermoanaerobaculia bacterium]|nr:FtsX-like permease family protein [Thermoanaerobaculia bacterium]